MNVGQLKKYLENFNDENEIYFFMEEVIPRKVEREYHTPIINRIEFECKELYNDCAIELKFKE